FATIQAGVNAVDAGGTVNVAAGTYKENVLVNKSVSLLGPNAAVAGASMSRNAEAVIHADASLTAVTNAVVQVTASNVNIKGFTLTGDDPLVVGAPLTSGADANALYAVQAPLGAMVSGLTVQNNILTNVFIGVRGDWGATGASTGNTIDSNWFHDIGAFD